jgi:hypothetical protein
MDMTLIPTKERIEVHVQPGFRALLAGKAEEAGMSMGDLLLNAYCQVMGIDPAEAIMPKRKRGRKPIIDRDAAPSATEKPGRKSRRKRPN